MSFGKYPFDKHTCYFDVSSFMHSDQDISLHPGVGYPNVNNETQMIDMSKFSSERIGQFIISKHTTTKSYYSTYYTLRGTVDFERHTEIFGSDILFPAILLHAAIYVSFWVPSRSAPARVSLCIISSLSFRIMKVSITDKLPPVSYSVW
jgi:hypothetical protein